MGLLRLTVTTTLPPPRHWQDFERLCRDLWAEIWGDPDTLLHGRGGQPQAGVDFFGRPHRGQKYAGVQCRLRGQLDGRLLTVSEIRRVATEAERFEPKLGSLILATTMPRDTRAQAAAREVTLARKRTGGFPVTVYAWPDIVDLLDKYPNVLDAYYPIRCRATPLPPPKLPPHYQLRRGIFSSLKQDLLSGQDNLYGITGIGTVCLQGRGGVGKSVLAAAVARDAEINAAFSEGVFWLRVGQRSEPLRLLSQLCAALGEPHRAFETVEEARNFVAGIVSDARMLLVLDDIWELPQAEALDVVGARSRLLITTRNAEVVTGVGATEHLVETLSPRESLTLLGLWVHKKPSELPAAAAEVAGECGYLPLALAMVGAMVRGNPNGWNDALARLRAKDLSRFETRFPGYLYPDLLRAIEVGVEALADDHQQRYIELAVFPEDVPFPTAAAATLWAAAGLSSPDARELLNRFANRSLLTRDAFGRFALHDLQADYVTSRVVDPSALHLRLVHAYRELCCEGFASGPNDGYYFQHLTAHLAAAGMETEKYELLFDFAWLATKLATTDINTLLDDYSNQTRDRDTSLVASALRTSAHILAQYPEQLATQLLGRLGLYQTARVQSLLSRVAPIDGRCWLRPRHPNLTPAGGPLLRILEGHSSTVTAVSALDLRRIVSASGDGTLRIWEVETGETLRTLKGHDGWIHALAVLDPRHVVTAHSGGILHLADLETATILKTFTGHAGDVTSLAVLDSQHVVSASTDQTVRVWDCKSGKTLKVLAGQSPLLVVDRQRLVCGSGDGGLHVWNLRTGETLRSLRTDSPSILSGDVGRLDSKRLITAFGSLRIWNLDDGTLLKTLDGWFTYKLAVLDARRVVVVPNETTTIHVLDAETGEKLNALKGHISGVKDFAVLEQGRLVSASRDQTLRIWDVDQNKGLEGVGGHASSVNAILALDRKRLVSASGDQSLGIWDLRAGKMRRSLKGHNDWVTAVALLDARRLVSASWDKTLRIWDLETGRVLRTLTGHSSGINAIAVLDGERLVSASEERDLRLWDLGSGETIMTLKAHNRAVTALALSDRQCLISGSRDKSLRVWDLDTGMVISVLKGHLGGVNSVAFLDSLRIVSASTDCTLRIWDLETGMCVQVLEGNCGGVNAVAVLDRQHIASASADGTLRIWNVDKGETSAVAQVDAPLYCLAAMNSRTIIAGDCLGRIHFFDILGLRRFAEQATC